MFSDTLGPFLLANSTSASMVRTEARGLVPEARSAEFIQLLSGMDISEDDIESSRVFADVLSVARRYVLSTYDASYLELAMREGSDITTLDTELIRAASQAGVRRFLSQQL